MRESWLPAAPESATLARALVRDAAVEQGLDDDGAWNLMLATSEAVSNAILHGTACSDGEQGDPAAVRLPWNDGLCVEVCDCGGFEAAPLPPGPDGPHGRGIPIIAAVVDHFEVVPDGRTRVRFAKRRRRLAAGGLGPLAELEPDAGAAVALDAPALRDRLARARGPSRPARRDRGRAPSGRSRGPGSLTSARTPVSVLRSSISIMSLLARPGRAARCC